MNSYIKFSFCFSLIILFVLLENLVNAEEKGFTVYTHSHVPCNDGGLSLGQAVAAAAIHRQTSATV